MLSSGTTDVRRFHLTVVAAVLAVGAGACQSGQSTQGAAPAASASAAATPQSGEAVLSAMHDKYASTWYHTLTFTQKTTLRTPADTMAIETWREKAMVPGKLRIDMERKKGNLTIIFANDSTYIVYPDSIGRHAGGNYLLTIGFDVYQQPVDQTVSALRAEKYSMTPVHEDTWEGRPVYVIGAAAGDTTSRQIWIDKDRLLFVRALGPAGGKDSAKTNDTRFENYVEMPGGGWLSERVEFYRDGKLRQQEEYSEAQTNVALDSALFVPKRGKPVKG
jgi:outer membrane lipoprotein-sorting protein